MKTNGGGTSNEPDKAPRDRLIEAASRLFCQKGINATGIDTVLKEAGTAKMTLYKLFGSKEKLVEVVLEEEGRRWRDWFLGALEDGNDPARAKLDRIFPLLREWFSQERFFGCPFINAVGEHDKNDQRLREITMRHKEQVLTRLAFLAASAGAQNPERVAHQLGLLMDGAIVAVMITREPALADAAADAAAAIIDRAIPGGVLKL